MPQGGSRGTDPVGETGLDWFFLVPAIQKPGRKCIASAGGTSDLSDSHTPLYRFGPICFADVSAFEKMKYH